MFLIHVLRSVIKILVIYIYYAFSVTYNIKMTLGEVKGKGADGNVYIQLFGSKGNTAKIQLRQAGDNKNLFESSQEYKFMVATSDVGKVFSELLQNCMLIFTTLIINTLYMHLQRQRYKPGDLAWASSPLAFNPLSPSIHIQILQTDLHTFPLRIS